MRYPCGPCPLIGQVVGGMMQKQAACCAQIRENPRFEALVRQRNRYAFFLAATIVVAYFSFILLIAFRPAWIGASLLDDMAVTWGVPFGLAIIALVVLLTVVYVRHANTKFDAEFSEIRRQALK